MPQGVLDLNAAIAPGLSGATSTDQAITQALNYWNNVVGTPDDSVDPYDDTTTFATAAIALLTAEQARIRNPAT